MKNLNKGLIVCTKMGTNKLVENTPNAPILFGPICLPKPKSLKLKKELFLGVRSSWPASRRRKFFQLSKEVFKLQLIGIR